MHSFAGNKTQQVLPFLSACQGARVRDARMLQQGLHAALLRALPIQGAQFTRFTGTQVQILTLRTRIYESLSATT
jgi:hypothetical protein